MIGTWTFITLSMAMRLRSMWIRRSLIGSYCQSTIITLVLMEESCDFQSKIEL